MQLSDQWDFLETRTFELIDQKMYLLSVTVSESNRTNFVLEVLYSQFMSLRICIADGVNYTYHW